MVARFEKESVDEAYKLYVTDSLQIIPQHKYKTVRFYDVIHPKVMPDIDAESVVNDIAERAGLEIIE